MEVVSGMGFLSDSISTQIVAVASTDVVLN